MYVVAIRGAITIDENTEENILAASKELIRTIEDENQIDKDKVASIVFSVTRDLNKVAPARAARELGYTNAALMCFNEMEVEDSLKKCIRLMVVYNSNLRQDQIKHIYLRGAKVLRPDLAK